MYIRDAKILQKPGQSPAWAIYLNLLFHSARLRVKYFELNHRNAEGLSGPGTARSLAGDAAGPGPASRGPSAKRQGLQKVWLA